MKHFIRLFFIFSLLGICLNAQAADEDKNTPDKNLSAAIVDDAKEVKMEFDKTVEVTKDAIVRDAKQMKEDIPKGLKEAKDSAIQQSREIKEGAKKELREIRENISNPSADKTKSESN